MSKARLRAAIATAVALTLALAGCTSANDDNNNTTILRIGQTSGITQLDPNTTTFTAERVLWSLLWDGLTAQTEDSVVPSLAESWTTSDDQLTWTFKLRSDVTFHDGRAFTAEDAAKNIERVLNPDVGSSQRSKITMVESAAAVDAQILEIRLTSPAPQLPAALADIKMTDVDDIANLNQNANGTGPFILSEFLPDQEVTLVRNADYWGEAPAMETIVVTKYGDTTSAQSALSSGLLDMMWGVPYDQIEPQVSTGLTAVGPEDPTQAAVFEIDNSSAPFDDVRARQALSFATDRDAIRAAAYGGFGVLNTGSTLISPNSPFATTETTDYSYDLQAAQALFAEAGVNEGDSLTCWATAGAYPEFAVTCQILQQSLAEIGIVLDIQTNEVSTWADLFYPAGKQYPGAIVPDLVSREAPPLPFVVNYFGDAGWSEGNWPGTAAFEEAKTVIQSSTDESALRDAFAQAQVIMSQEQPVVSILNVGPASLLQSNLTGVWVEPSGTTHVEGARFTN